MKSEREREGREREESVNVRLYRGHFQPRVTPSRMNASNSRQRVRERAESDEGR